LNGVIGASLVERITIERLEGVEDVIQRHKDPSLRQFAPVRQVLDRTSIRRPEGEKCPFFAVGQRTIIQYFLGDRKAGNSLLTYVQIAGCRDRWR
jgi:hypothetical protein